MTQPKEPSISPERMDRFSYDGVEGLVFYDEDGNVMPAPLEPQDSEPNGETAQDE